jgi:hypothetical protein
VQQLDKHRWQLDCKAGQPVELHWQVCAYDTSVRTAWLDSRRGFFNGTSLCLRVHGQERTPHALEIARSAATPADWQLATGLTPHAVDARLWPLPGGRLRRAGGLPGGTGRLLAAALHRLRRAPPLCGGRRPGQL